jgi:hypothetical protein
MVMEQIRAVDSPNTYSLPTAVEKKHIIEQIRAAESPVPVEKQDKPKVESEEEYLASILERKKTVPVEEVKDSLEVESLMENADEDLAVTEALESESVVDDQVLATPVKDLNESAFRETNGK